MSDFLAIRGTAYVARRQQGREHQLSHFDSLDNKAGLVLGFVGLLATLAPATAGGWFVFAGLVAAAAAAGFALAAFWPRRFATLEPTALRDYVAAEEQFTRLTVLDTLELVVNRGSDVLHTKGVRVKAAMGAWRSPVWRSAPVSCRPASKEVEMGSEPDTQPEQQPQSAPPPAPPRQPDESLIGYIERGNDGPRPEQR